MPRPGRAGQGEVAFERTDAGANIGNAHTLLLLDPAGFETASVIRVVEPDQAVDADQQTPRPRLRPRMLDAVVYQLADDPIENHLDVGIETLGMQIGSKK